MLMQESGSVAEMTRWQHNILFESLKMVLNFYITLFFQDFDLGTTFDFLKFIWGNMAVVLFFKLICGFTEMYECFWNGH